MSLSDKRNNVSRRPIFRFAAVLALLCMCVLTGTFVTLAAMKTGSGSAVPVQTLGKIPLTGEWKIMYGDSEAYAEKDYDDSSWATVDIPANTINSAAGLGAVQWLRRSVYIPQYNDSAFNAIMLGAIHSADEVYLNGILIGSTGSMTNEWDIDYDVARIYRLPRNVTEYGAMNTIAVRVRPVFSDIAGIYRGEPAIGDHSDFSLMSVVKDLPQLIVFYVLILAALVFLAFSATRYGKDDINLQLGAFMLLMALFSFSTTQIRSGIKLDFVLEKSIKFSVLALIMPFLLRFVYMVLLPKNHDGKADKFSVIMDRVSKWSFLYPALYIAANLIIGDFRLWRTLDYAVNDRFIAIFATFVIIMILYKAVKGNKIALILLTGTFVFFLTVIYDIAVPEYSPLYTINYSPFGALFMILSMVMIFFYRMYKLNSMLSIANAEIEDINRNLELQVREKTGDLIKTNEVLEIRNTQLTDLNERMKKAQELLETAATTDSLTGLFNRFELDKRITHEESAVKRYSGSARDVFSIVFFDIDNFKYINDTFGHQAGDLILVLFSMIIKKTIREVDIASRYGGDEFLILMPGTNEAGAVILAQRISESLKEKDSFRNDLEELLGSPVLIDSRHELSASYGVASYREGESVQDMIRRADRALYVMKGIRMQTFFQRGNPVTHIFAM